ncbi:MAG: PA14 domain-containing protein, partial [Candidatus Omnitrophica bacterium]|nr:PA14 domain-containing protein [Candidatus Omnitrophota bacterium]
RRLGWYIDDIVVRSLRNLNDSEAHFQVPGFGAIAGIGNFNQAGSDDFAILDTDAGGGNGAVYIYYGTSARFSGTITTPNVTLANSGSLAGYEVRAAGNVNGDTYQDFLVTSATKTYLVLGRASHPGGSLLSEIADTGRGWMFGAGDVNGDGVDDLGAISLEISPKIDETGNMVAHPVGQIIFGQANLNSLGRPDLVFEPAPASYTDATSAVLPKNINFFNRAGRVNNDAKSDLISTAAMGHTVYLHLGASITAYTPPAVVPGSTPSPERFVFDLATPSYIEPGSSAAHGIDLSDTTVDSPSMRDAFMLEGDNALELLANALQVGDFDGDGNNDFLVTGQYQSYLLLGPVNINGQNDVSERAEIIFDTASLGRPAVRMGDVNGDGVSDLAFIRHDATAGQSVITIIYGGRVLPRQVTASTASSLDPLYVRVIRLDDARFRPDNAEIYILNFSGQINPISGQLYHDVLVFSPEPGISNLYGYIFNGKDIDAQTAGSLGPGGAAVDLQLFTTIVSSTDLALRIPALAGFNSTDARVQFPVAQGPYSGSISDTANHSNTIIDGTPGYDSFSHTDNYPVGNGLTGNYYNYGSYWVWDFCPFTGHVVNYDNQALTRTDPVISFNWGTGSPDPAVQSDQFRAVWTGYITPRQSGTYYFRVLTDDGIRLTVNSNLIIDSWQDQAPTYHESGGVQKAAGFSSMPALITQSASNGTKTVVAPSRNWPGKDLTPRVTPWCRARTSLPACRLWLPLSSMIIPL